ncbi:MAG: hypothetical protein KDC95_15700 [Planctomycetes bacterium]|nr:hypothetical protein [Planctomycetota bacterium]
MTFAASQVAAQADNAHSLDGEWTYLEDRTEGRALDRLGPPMGTTFSLRVEKDAVILVRGHGSGHRDVRVANDGSMTEITVQGKTARYRGGWTDGAFAYEVDFIRGPGQEPAGLVRREFHVTKDGLIVRSKVRTFESVGLYRHAEDIPMPAPTKATIGDLAWLAGAWIQTKKSGTTIEERWSPPRGGAMLGTSRTVSRGQMSAFEFLRIVERDSGLIYVAQPGGNPPTEFVLTERTDTRAVFDNPRHSYPKRIIYELSAEGHLSATIGFLKGGTPRRFEFERAEG